MAKIRSGNVVCMLELFGELEDPRCSINQKHLLGDLIVICICGVIAGADGPKAIGVWANANAQWLRQYLELPNGIPSHDTIGRLLATLKPSAFQSCFQKWIASLRGVAKDATDAVAVSESEIIAIDGRRSGVRTTTSETLAFCSWSVLGRCSVGSVWGSLRRPRNRTKSRRFPS